MTHMHLPVTMLYAGLNALILLVLAILAVRARVKTNTVIGTGDNIAVVKAVRAHGNATEYVPVALILIAVLEISGMPPYLLHGLGGALTLGRLLHAQGLLASVGTSPGRLVGTLLTWLVYLVGGSACLVHAIW